ncbi:hypothetical protein ONS95_009075 [Cadophora gregata]|uniref:uncharacterized protein n=1 Tax=Cadophora gregata TaxID=51156 RepID=UPI0026DC7AE8|nr:uncharacterized protein ONS95_009075 [Cadophora gregata]KAK0124092.1 hypothetical protein ONS95_009075 [Cadophora gregata]KAK0130425.1 hypothetical protein ONS96_000944 [Cadophora gregata f. sp. sojae]
MINDVAPFIFGHKVGCRLDTVEVFLGTYANTQDRPDMKFLCCRSDIGELNMEDNRHEVDATLFRGYLFDGEDIDDWEAAMAGADLKMAHSEENEEIGDDLESLFGSTLSDEESEQDL